MIYYPIDSNIALGAAFIPMEEMKATENYLRNRNDSLSVLCCNLFNFLNKFVRSDFSGYQ